MENSDITRAGFIAVVGAPNVGKSTFINRAVGTKVSIVSPKVQTTRTRILGISSIAESQIILIDTPGIFLPRRRLDRAMVSAAWTGAANADLILLLVDAARGIDKNTGAILKKLVPTKRRIFAAINKIDLIKKESLLGLTSELNAFDIIDEIFMISAKTGDGVRDLLESLANVLPTGPWLFPNHQVSDMPERLLAAEITREKLYIHLRQELPYVTTVETESWDENPSGTVKINQIIYVQRTTQRTIVIGKNGQQIKAIGAAARKELVSILGCDVQLFLFVKVREKWVDDPERYRDWNLDFNA
ncbi:MAG: GTPase Era [Magnetovibrio sp.]|nr:GTPase Era [Magnetovibrio sp.]|tara:strand:- start:173 stop:1078 length:906 start_codon:yes stop_codon:yes gene_type:complete